MSLYQLGLLGGYSGGLAEATFQKQEVIKFHFVYPASKCSFIILLYEPRNLHLEPQQYETFLALGNLLPL